MRNDIQELFDKEEYDFAVTYIKELLQSNPKNAELWYALFLADNKGYENMDIDNIKNEIAFNKAFELATLEQRKQYGKEYNDFKDFTLFLRLDNPKIIEQNNVINKDKIKHLIIPKGVEVIGENAFYECRNLESITIPSSVKIIEECAFSWCCKLVEIYNYSSLKLTIGSENNGHIAEYAKVIHTKEEPSIIKTTKDGVFNYIEDDIEYDKYYLLSCNEEKSNLILPNNLEGYNYEIYNYAFSNCNNLVNVIIGNRVTQLGAFSFSDCSNLIRITIPKSVTAIEKDAFSGCYKLVEIYNYSNLELTIGSEENGKVVEYAKVIHTKEESSIINTTKDGLYSYIFFDEEYDLFSYNGNENTITLPNDLEGNKYEIYLSAFSNCSHLKNVIIPNSVTCIDDYAFSNCENLESVKIGNAVTSIGEYAFFNCQSLKSITIPDSLTRIREWAFMDCGNMARVTLGKGIKNIETCAFNGCNKLVEIYNYSNLKLAIGSNENGELTQYAKVIHTKEEESIIRTTKDGEYEYIEVGGKYYLLSYKGNDKNIVLPTDLEGHNYGIIDYAFSGCDNLKSIIIPNNVISIGSFAFEICSGLTEITIPNRVKSIGQFAFFSCNRLTNITLGDSVTSIGDYAFCDCSRLSSIIIPSSITSIGDFAFHGCKKLDKVYYYGKYKKWEKILGKDVFEYEFEIEFKNK